MHGYEIWVNLGMYDFSDPDTLLVLSDLSSDAILELQLHDLDEDGLQDLLFYDKNGSGDLSYLKHNGGLDFSDTMVISPHPRWHKISEIGDIDQDGIGDLAVAYPHLNALSLLTQTEGYQLAEQPIFEARLEEPNSVCVYDFSGDGIPDLLYGSSTANAIFIRRGLGDKSFGPPQVFADYVLGVHELTIFEGAPEDDPVLLVTQLLESGYEYELLVAEWDASSLEIGNTFPICNSWHQTKSLHFEDVNRDGLEERSAGKQDRLY